MNKNELKRGDKVTYNTGTGAKEHGVVKSFNQHG